ncbi:MAG: alpha/beta hydrolase [Polyangiaceae bacterium]
MADVEARGLKFHVQRLGSPDAPATVVMLHGLVMDNLSSLYFTLGSALAASCDVVLYDLRGHGLSSRPESGYTLCDMVEDLASILDALAVNRPVFLVGNSFGGLLALGFATAHPERVRGVVLVDGHVGQTGWADAMSATLELKGEERDRQIAISFQSWLGRHSEKKSTRLARTASALVYGTSLVADMRASGSLPAEAMRNIQSPVLALYGETSDLLPAAREAERLIPRFDLIVFEGCSHSVLWEVTARVRDVVLGWIAARSRE